MAARSDGLKGTSIVNADNIAGQVAVLKGRLATLDRERSKIVDRLSALEYTQASEAADQPSQIAAHVTTASPSEQEDRTLPEPVPWAGGGVSAPMGEPENREGGLRTCVPE